MQSDSNSTILHIGFPKTGTSWFQKYFYPMANGINFYDYKRIRETLGNNIRDATDQKEAFKSKDRLVICDESMIGSYPRIEANANLYRRIFGQAHVIIFIRNQIEKYYSNYSQYIIQGGTAKFKNFLFPDAENLIAGKKHCYDDVITLYKAIFKAEYVHIYLYEEFTTDFSNFMEHFCSEHKFDINIKSLKNKKVNRRPFIFLIHLKRICNMFSRKYTFTTNYNMETLKRYYFHVPYLFELSSFVVKLIIYIFPYSGKVRMGRKKVEETKQIIVNFFSESNNRLIREHDLEKIKHFNYPL